MAVTASLSSRALTVEPGESTTIDVALHNDGPAAETVTIRVAGPARPYSFVVPETVSIEPAGNAVARLGFRLPHTSVPAAGPLPFTISVGEGAAPAAEGVVEVTPFSALSATLDPTEAAGKGPTKYRVQVANRGNAPVAVELAARPAEGVDVTLDPTSVVAGPDSAGTATAEVKPRKGLFTGAEREFPFTIVATPAYGSAVEVGGRFRQQVAVAAKTLVRSGVVAGVVVIGLVLALTVFPGGDSSPSATPDGDGGVVGTVANDCPAEGHRDVYVSGQRPEDIPKLPNSYSFLFIKADGCFPVRFNPCEPIHYVQNLALAPPTGAADAREAFNKLSQVTGITFVDDGTTDETARRRPYVPERYGERWAPILVLWSRFGNQGPDPTIQAVGRGIGSRVDDVLVSGQLSLNVDAVTNRETRTPVQGGFGPPIGSGTGAIGPEAVTWGRIILHELAHVIGLGHTRDRGAIMYPETAEQTSRPSEYRPPDRDGLRFLGREAGCLTTPTPRST